MRIDESLPRGWSTRVLVSLQALSLLKNGSVVTQPGFVQVKGVTGNPDAKATISRILSDKLGDSENYSIAITYKKALDPVANLPSPQECVDKINAVLKEQKVTFSPSSADIDREGLKAIDRIADIMKDCTEVPMEVGGHTDSQGRESMNLGLSQSRAEAVINALLARRVLTSNLVAKGYGESKPIADNSTEAGREANRRIEFRLLTPEEKQAEQSANSESQAPASTTQKPSTGTANEQN